MGIRDWLSRRLDELSEDFLPDEVRDSVEGARELLRRGDNGAAAAALEAALREKPDHASALYLLGVARLRLGQVAQAVGAFEKAIAARANFSEAMIGLGEARLLLGDAPTAIATVRAALATGGVRETLADAYRVLGRAYLLGGQRDKGVRELRKALAEDPDDPDAAVALAEALLGDANADPDEARGALERMVSEGDAPPVAKAALGRILARRGDHEQADRLIRAALTLPATVTATATATPTATLDGAGPIMSVLDRGSQADAWAALADIALARRDAAGAHDAVLRALELAPSRADLHARLADARASVKSYVAAVSAYQDALRLGAGDDVLHRALEVARAGDLPEQVTEFAARILAARPDDARARSASAVAAARPAEDASAAVAAARAALAVDPADPAARALLVDATRRELGAQAPAGDLYALARRFHAMVLARPELAEIPGLAVDAAQAIESYDRPLLVTVMGEFSSGKSTFVNAFLGADVAPVGITPTTATINILKYGRERAARIVYLDDRVRDLEWSEVPRVLRGVDAKEAARIRFVEVMVPHDALQRVNIVDTPGLNSILPEHEATARGFLAQADAIVWLFTVGQAGKATEREALEKIRAEGKRVLGVLNKIDQASSDEVAAIVAHVGAELGGLVEALVPVSARRAVAARTAGDDAALAASQWPVLEAALEERFFRQARALKRAAIARRLGALAARARDRVAGRASQARSRADELGRAATAARTDAVLFSRELVPAERKALAERVAASYRAAAREVLELVRPRKVPFGSHQATGPDRDFLLGFLDRELAAALAPIRGRVGEELRRSAADAARAAASCADVVGAAAAGELAELGAAAASLVDARVFDRAAAFARGHLRGGRLDEFFARTLPKLDLSEDNVYHALVRDAPDLDSEIAGALSAHGDAALRGLAARLERLAGQADVIRLESEEAVLAALDAAETERAQLTGGGAA